MKCRFPMGFFDGVRGALRFDEPLARYTSMRVGGPADALLDIDEPDDLPVVLLRCEAGSIPWFVLAGGTNLVVRDGGVRGLVLKLGKRFRAISRRGERITAGAAVKGAQLLDATVKAHLAGFEFLAEIPGEVGGLVVMNAGAGGGEMKDIVESVTVADEHGFHAIAASALGFSYRHCEIPRGSVITSAVLRGEKGDAVSIRAEIGRRRERRRATQPTDATSCGSVFKNPPDDFAGRLIEAAGLKGRRIGAIEVSTKHANFFINTDPVPRAPRREGTGTATDVIALIELVRSTVRDRFDVDLEPEVHIVGEESAA